MVGGGGGGGGVYLENKGEGIVVVRWKTWPLNYHTVLGVMS